jgi:hypothetical protein
MSHDMNKIHDKNCQCVRCKPLERSCGCDHCTLYKFKQELKTLLEKYNASIFFEVGSGSDNYGLYDEDVVICFNPITPEKHITCFSLSKGWSITKKDL